ncbi:MAG: ABC transporter substrate-binding protein, partial [Candidatus Odinarchaeota archaeon]
MIKKCYYVFLLLPCLIIVSMPFQQGSRLGTTVTTATTAVSYQVPEEGKGLGWPRASGFAGELYYMVIRGNEQQVLALKAGEIDLVGGFIDTPLIPTLYNQPDIELNVTGESSFGCISLNCGYLKFTNRQEFRQAFAHALDKNGIQVRARGGYSRSVDSIISPVMGTW